jgi:hypothetical protein
LAERFAPICYFRGRNQPKRINLIMAKNKELPDLHKQAFKYKNRKRLQHDGGRAWSQDSQLHEAIKGRNYHLETIDGEKGKDAAIKVEESAPTRE